MVGPGTDVGNRRPRPSRDRRLQTGLFALAFVGLASGTAVGTLLARNDARAALDRRTERAADRGATALESEVQRKIAGLAGAGVIVGPDGELQPEVFSALTADLLAAGEVDGTALIGVVAAEDRGGFEDSLGGPITSIGDDGQVVPAPSRSTYFPILAIEPDLPGRSAVGVDFGADPIRGAAIRDLLASGDPTVSGVVELTAGGDRGVAVLRPLADRSSGSPIRGLIATGIPIEQLRGAAEASLDPGMEAAIVDGDEIVVGAAFDAREQAVTTPVRVPGQAWTLAIRSSQGPNLVLSWFIATGGTVALLAMALLVIVTERLQRRTAAAKLLLDRSHLRSRAVQEVTGRLARALTADEVAAALLEHLPTAVGAEAAVVATTNAAGELQLLRDLSGGSSDPEELAITGSGSLVEATVTDGRSAWLPSPLAWRGDVPTATLAGDAMALALLPLAAEDVAGVLAVAYARVHTFGDDEQALLETVSVLAARALARGRRYDAEHRAAVAFQRSALPSDLPAVPGLTIAARYRPATLRATVGGDWYDVVVLDDRRVLLVVGDVVGHGVVAAAAMGRLRTAFQAIGSLRSDPAEILQAVDRQAVEIPDALCATVVCAVVDVERGTLSWSRAGHLPPLLFGDGAVTWLDEPGQPPLGLAKSPAPPAHTRLLRPGERLVLFTDGVVERRGEVIDIGLGRLAVVTQELADLEPEDFTDALVQALVPMEEQADDVVVLVMRYDGPPASR